MENTIVQISIKEYENLKSLAEANEDKMKLVAKKELDKLQSEGAISIYIKPHWNFEDKLVTINTYKELSPQLQFLVQKFEYWLEDEMEEQFKAFDYIKDVERRNVQLSKDLSAQIKASFFGWLGFVSMLVITASYFIFK